MVNPGATHRYVAGGAETRIFFHIPTRHGSGCDPTLPQPGIVVEMGEGVLIGNGRCCVRLTQNGPANELGYPAIIDVRAGPFQGSILDETIVIEPFRTQLVALDETLRSQAKLSSYEGLDVVLVGNGTGGIGVDVKTTADHVAPMRLTFSFGIDQSYLPAIIQQIDAEFPPPYRAL